jgi:hypothetical protein
MNKLPHELRVIVSRKVSDEDWESTEVMETIHKEIEARERVEANPITPVMKKQYKGIPTAASLLSGDTAQGPTCAYCGQPHPSNSCRSVVDVEARKRILLKDGRCFLCLKKQHVSRNCRSSLKCSNCHGQHHVSICFNGLQGGMAREQQSTIPPAKQP